MSVEVMVIKPFDVPDFVIAKGRLNPYHEGTYSLSELSSEILAEMCEEFRRRVFEKAGKVLPIKYSRHV
jgi:hypothetical protein